LNINVKWFIDTKVMKKTVINPTVPAQNRNTTSQSILSGNDNYATYTVSHAWDRKFVKESKGIY